MRLRTLFLTLTLTLRLAAQHDPGWTTNHAPFRIAGNLYYVGSDDLASYLVTTPAGNILINSDLASSVPQIRRNIEALGFRFADVKILLISHAHADHDAGSAEIKRLTGAMYEVMEADASVVESGGRTDFHYGPRQSYPSAKVDHVLHDGEAVRLGGTTLIAHLTPGHTKGCTTWTMQLRDQGRTYNVVIIGSTSINPGYRLVGDPKYPHMAEDYAQTFRLLKSLPCDLFLGAHGSYFNMEEKYQRLIKGDQNAFFDPNGYSAFVKQREQSYLAKLAEQARTFHSRH